MVHSLFRFWDIGILWEILTKLLMSRSKWGISISRAEKICRCNLQRCLEHWKKCEHLKKIIRTKNVWKSQSPKGGKVCHRQKLQNRIWWSTIGHTLSTLRTSKYMFKWVLEQNLICLWILFWTDDPKLNLPFTLSAL